MTNYNDVMTVTDLSDLVAIGFDVADDTDTSQRHLISEEFTFRLHAKSDRAWGRPIDPNLGVSQTCVVP